MDVGESEASGICPNVVQLPKSWTLASPFPRKKKNQAFGRNRSEERGGCPGREQSRESEREGREGWGLSSPALHKACLSNSGHCLFGDSAVA